MAFKNKAYRSALNSEVQEDYITNQCSLTIQQVLEIVLDRGCGAIAQFTVT